MGPVQCFPRRALKYLIRIRCRPEGQKCHNVFPAIVVRLRPTADCGWLSQADKQEPGDYPPQEYRRSNWPFNVSKEYMPLAVK